MVMNSLALSTKLLNLPPTRMPTVCHNSFLLFPPLLNLCLLHGQSPIEIRKRERGKREAESVNRDLFPSLV